MATLSPEFLDEMKQFLQNPRSKQEILRKKLDLAKRLKIARIPTDIELMLSIDSSAADTTSLLTKPTRTMAGVAPIAVMTSPAPCPHGKCTYCPGGIDSPFGTVPQSYTGKEPSTMRAERHNYDAFLIVFNRLEQYVLMGHCPEKVELIIMGGTFPARPLDFQEKTVTDCLSAMNIFGECFFPQGKFKKDKFKTFFEIPGDFKDELRVKRVQKSIADCKVKTSLIAAQKKNETAFIRCIGITIETRPDFGGLKEGKELLALGVTKVEVGVQTVYNKVLSHVKRGHTIQDAKKSIRILKDLGFKINIHYMLGLPKTTPRKDLLGLKTIFSDEDLRPDMLKIYPCGVAKGTELYEEWKSGKFKAITTEMAANILIKWKPTVPRYCRIMRIVRDVPAKQWEAGVDATNLRQILAEKYHVTCNCIRCREPKTGKIDWKNVQISAMEYSASKGTEFFISADDKTNDKIVGFCRLRIPSKVILKEIGKNAAIIRELHVYGMAAGIGQEGTVQHRGIGKLLLARAEHIARSHKKEKIIVISGIGAREYYRKQGFNNDSHYVSKVLNGI